MKSALIIVISAITCGSIGFIIGGKTNHPSEYKNNTSQNLPENRRVSPSHKSTYSPRNLISNMNDKSQRGIMANIDGILKLNSREIKKLLAAPDFATLDESTTPLFKAALSRLTEIDPTMAIHLASGLAVDRKKIATQAIFKEWGTKDPEKVIKSALNGDLLHSKKIALYHALISLSKQDPSRAFNLAHEHGIHEALPDIMSNIAKNDHDKALERCSLLSPYLKNKNQDLIIKDWALTDPKKAEDYVEGIKNKNEKSKLLIGLIDVLDANRGLELLQRNITAFDPRNLVKVTAKLAKEEPWKMMAWIRNQPEGGIKNNLAEESVKHWFSADESKTIAYINAIENKQAKKSITVSLLTELAYENPRKFFELQPFLESNQGYSQNLSTALTTLGKKDAQYAIEYLNGLNNPKQRRHASQCIVEGLSKNNPDQALVIAEQLNDPSERDAALASIYKKISRKNPATVAQVFKERGMTDIGSFSVANFVFTYASSNLEEAKSFVDSIEDTHLWDKSISKLLYVWADDEPLDAMEFVLHQEPTKGIKSAISRISFCLAEGDRQKVLNMALANPPNSTSQEILSCILHQWIDRDLGAAVKAIANSPIDRTGTKIYSTLAKRYADINAAEGAQWVNTIQDDIAKESATSTLTSKWLNSDLDSAISWIEQLQNGSQRDTAVNHIISKFNYSNPAYAIEWASTLSDEESSNRLIRNTYNTWQKRDPQASSIWLNSTNLVTESQREIWSR